MPKESIAHRLSPEPKTCSNEAEVSKSPLFRYCFDTHLVFPALEGLLCGVELLQHGQAPLVHSWAEHSTDAG